MSAALEDRFGQLTMLALFSVLLMTKVNSFAAMMASSGGDAFWSLRLLQDLLSLAFLALVVAMTIRRLPASHGPAGIEPRITAVAGTFALMGLVALPAGEAPMLARLAGITLMAVGLAGSIYALLHLGRAFSIAPTARELVTSGPYGIVRHPLYLTEALTAVGIVIAHWSWPAVLLGAVQFALQYRRIGHEEQVLRDAFPDSYQAYAARVPQLLPRLGGQLRRA
ncbi:methyltransferase family protein [Sandarakinorhabdus rubra]|uniref:methyltransferase family protein n=1 Tax=Sandarakinorhabdus rubra TaxID=2672568 RepID=UPI0013DB25BB|nr:isoprenylcysteine carboxylmethyltransferase family protein [Sandarakinorhabdus rubra]